MKARFTREGAVRPEAGRSRRARQLDASRRLRLDERAVDFFRACERLGEVSDHAVASGWYEKRRASLRGDEMGVGKAIPAVSRQGATKTAVKVLEGEVSRRRCMSLKANGCGLSVVDAADKAPIDQRMKRRAGAEACCLRGEVGPAPYGGGNARCERKPGAERHLGLTDGNLIPGTKAVFTIKACTLLIPIPLLNDLFSRRLQ